MRPTRAIIDLEAIRYNIRQIRAAVPAGACVTAVVKANAYGHGAVPVAHAAASAGADAFAVAIPEEGAELRAAGFEQPILILGLTAPEQADLIVAHQLTAAICTREGAAALAKAARAASRRARIALKVDTGMGRIGIPPAQAVALAKELTAMPELELRTLFTHLATADAADKMYAVQQLAQFQQAVNELQAAGITIPYLSAANSASIIDLKSALYNTVRPGIILYGLPPSHEMQNTLDLHPAMSLVTRIVYIKEVPAGTPVSYGCTYHTPERTYLATLPIGYADGYSRHLSNLAPVLIGGKRRPVVGRVCMDQIIVNLGPVCDAAIGDEAVLFGRQGSDEITVTELADLAGTINYELVSGISPRVPRVYLDK